MSSTDNRKPNLILPIVIILVAALTRLLFLDIPNVAPIAAMALFAGAYLKNRRLAVLLPVLALLFSDTILQVMYATGNSTNAGFYPSMLWVYGAIIATIFIGVFISKRFGVLSIVGGSLAASVIFFLTTNFGVWSSGVVGYPMSFQGLIQSYVAGIPFFHYTVIGDLAFTAILFGGYELIKYRFPKLAYVKA